nr:MAG TPA: hypothetical protein [Caudoviricetes sp.]
MLGANPNLYTNLKSQVDRLLFLCPRHGFKLSIFVTHLLVRINKKQLFVLVAPE